MSFNLKITRQDFDDIASASGLDPADFDIAYADAKEHIKVSTDSKKHQYSSTNSAKRLFDKWYRSVKKGNPDYEGVYGDPSYITDIWACWKMYSRDSVNVLNSPKSMNGISVVEYIMNEIGHIDTVVDAGCGFAYTTGLLKEIFPDSNVTGTNLINTWQYDFAKKLGQNNNFDIVPEITTLKNVDVIFASEYFEHFYEPIAHLKDVLDNCSPKFLITANGFGGDAIGHFDDYRVDEDLDDSDNKWDLFSGEDVKGGNIQSSKETSKRFNQYLKDRGYTKLDTKIWNSRPAVWQKGPIITSMSAKFEKLFD
jgi:SAM-dependent methyltransferase